MNNFGKVDVKMGLRSLLSVMARVRGDQAQWIAAAVILVGMAGIAAAPLSAQIDTGVDFKTSFPFYAGNTMMPAGSYKITQSDANENVLQVESSDGKHSGFVDFIPTHSEQPHPQSDVTFHKYGDAEYLNRVWVEGQKYGMKLDPTKAETKAAANANVVEHSLVAYKR